MWPPILGMVFKASLHSCKIKTLAMVTVKIQYYLRELSLLLNLVIQNFLNLFPVSTTPVLNRV